MPSGKSLQGCALSDFMGGDEDRERFKEVVSGYSANSSAGLSPSMLSIYMRDAIGNSIKTILYHVPYRSIAGRCLGGWSLGSVGPPPLRTLLRPPQKTVHHQPPCGPSMRLSQHFMPVAPIRGDWRPESCVRLSSGLAA